MNIFVLHENPRVAAQMHCDKHVPKMIIEHTQMLAAAYYSTLGISRKKEIPDRQSEVNSLFSGWPRKKEDGSDFPYAISHVNHPCTVWTRGSIENFNWLLDCTEELCHEFFNRWKNNQHSIKAIIQWMQQNPPKLESKGLQPFAMAMPDFYRGTNPVEAYRRYYAFKKTYMKVAWDKLNNTPYWMTDSLIEEAFNTFKLNQKDK
jgi:hypothetical protein